MEALYHVTTPDGFDLFALTFAPKELNIFFVHFRGLEGRAYVTYMRSSRGGRTCNCQKRGSKEEDEI